MYWQDKRPGRARAANRLRLRHSEAIGCTKHANGFSPGLLMSLARFFVGTTQERHKAVRGKKVCEASSTPMFLTTSPKAPATQQRPSEPRAEPATNMPPHQRRHHRRSAHLQAQSLKLISIVYMYHSRRSPHGVSCPQARPAPRRARATI